MLKVSNLDVKFSDLTIYQNSSFTISRNGIYFLKGRNGLGKSTLLKTLKGLLNTNISMEVDGRKNPFNDITYITNESIFNRHLSIKEQFSLLSNDERLIKQMVSDFNLQQVLEKKGSSLSNGQKAKVAFVLGVLEGNKVILIDEIFNHLDLAGAKMVLNYLEQMRQTKIIIYTTHQDKVPIKNDGILEIKDKTIKVTMEEPKSFVSRKLDIVPSHINLKILRKFFNFKPRFIISFCLALIGVVLLYLVEFSNLSRDKIYQTYYEESNLYPYIVSEYSVGESNSYTTNSEIYNLAFEGKTYETVSKNMPYSFFDFYKAGIEPIYENFTKNMIITDHFRDITLEDKTIVISDYVARIFANLIYQVADKLFIDFYDIPLEVKIFNTKYEELVDKYEDYANPFLILSDEEYVNDYSAVYYNMYLNANTFALMEEARGAYLKQNYEKYNDIKLEVTRDSEGIYGRLPEAPGEVVISADLYHGSNLENLGTYFLTLEIYREDNLTSLRLNKMYQVVGIDFNSSQTVYFFDEATLNDYFYKTAEERTLAFEGNNIYLTDLDLLRQKGLALADDNYYLALDTYDFYQTIKDKLDILIVAVVFLTIIALVSYYAIDLKSQSRDIKLMFSKNISKKQVLKAKWLPLLYNVLVVFVVLVCLYCSVYFTVMDQINMFLLDLLMPLPFIKIDYIFYLFIFILPIVYALIIILLERLFLRKSKPEIVK